MRLLDLNSQGGIGANCLLLELGPFRFIVDSGLHPKMAGREALPAFERVAAGSVDFIILTHCHLDHLGGLPVLMRQQPQAPVFMTQPSLLLAPRMLHNSCNVMLRQKEELGLSEYPLFTHGEVDQCARRFTGLPFNRTRTFTAHGEALSFTFHPAGHVAGAAGVELLYKHRKIFLTADVLFTPQRILPGAKFPAGPFDTVVVETTRGLTERTPEKTREKEVQRLIETVQHTYQRGGSTLLPAFALGRTQELMSILHEAKQQGRLPPAPIYSGGLGMALVDEFDEICRKTGLVQFRRKIVKDLALKPLPQMVLGRAPRDRGIYLLSSGMMVENTPSYAAAAALVHDHASTIAFVGYCDPDTPGGRMLAAAPEESFLFEKLDYAAPLRARVEKFDLSSHADREELLEFTLKAQPRAIVLTHGDPGARAWFAQAFQELAPEARVLDPEPLIPHTV